jgi:predicted transcriptional regulator
MAQDRLLARQLSLISQQKKGKRSKLSLTDQGLDVVLVTMIQRVGRAFGAV